MRMTKIDKLRWAIEAWTFYGPWLQMANLVFIPVRSTVMDPVMSSAAQVRTAINLQLHNLIRGLVNHDL